MNVFAGRISRTLLALSICAILGGSAEHNDRRSKPNRGAKEEPVNGGGVTIHCLVEPSNLNCITSTSVSAQGIHDYIYESLTSSDWETLETIPWIAESLPTTSADRRSYEFRIRRDARFSDGHPITGEDFIFFLKTVKNPHIAGAAQHRAFYSRISHAELIDGDPYRLRVVMTEPYYLGDQYAGGLTALPKHIWDPQGITDSISFEVLDRRGGGRDDLAKEFAMWYQDSAKQMSPTYLVGSGPYVFMEWERNERVLLTRNESYWNGAHKYGKSYPDWIAWRAISDMSEAVKALKRGEIDVIPSLEKSTYAELRSSRSADMATVEYDYPSYTYIGYNQSHGVLRDRLVRRALAHALDRGEMVDKVLMGLARPVQSPILRTRPEYDTSIPLIAYDLERAKRLLAQAGWSDMDGDGILDRIIDGAKKELRFEILINTGNRRREQMAAIFVESLKKIGVQATVTTVDWVTYLDRLRMRTYDAYIGGWALSASEGDMAQIWHSSSTAEGGLNHIGFRNARVDELIDRVRAEFDYAKRKQLYREIQSIIHEEQPYNFLVSEKYAGVYRKKFRNVKFYGPRPCFNVALWWVPKNEQTVRADAGELISPRSSQR